MASDYHQAEIAANDQLLLKYAEKLTRAPASVQAGDVALLKEAGFSDRAIFDANQVIAYFNYVNRIADGLGVELE
ncbi:MAG: peroxidase [Halanaerobiales bacterium]|nr:peroxidase [Halanaerobiales bacterium]